MEELTTEENFQLTQAIDAIDSQAEETFDSTDSEAVDEGVFNSR